MRTFDLAPLYRSTVGFDRLFSMLDNVAGFDGGSGSSGPAKTPIGSRLRSRDFPSPS
jgi:hypothetical protein